MGALNKPQTPQDFSSILNEPMNLNDTKNSDSAKDVNATAFIRAAKAEEKRRKTLAEEAKMQKNNSQYQDQLTRRRYQDQLAEQ